MRFIGWLLGLKCEARAAFTNGPPGAKRRVVQCKRWRWHAGNHQGPRCCGEWKISRRGRLQRRWL